MILSAFYEAIMARITNYYVTVTNTATSVTSNAITVGSKTFTTQAGLSYAIGNRIRFAKDATHYMDGIITEYAGTTLTATIDITFGGGTFTSWNIGLAVPVIKHMDVYFSQDLPIESDEDYNPFLRPAAFLRFNSIAWETFGNNMQQGVANFDIVVCADVIQEVSRNQPVAIRNLGHAHLAHLDNIFKYLQGYSGSFFSSISRTNLEPYHPNGLVMGHTINFRTRLTDRAAMPPRVPALPQQELTLVIDNSIPPPPAIPLIP